MCHLETEKDWAKQRSNFDFFSTFAKFWFGDHKCVWFHWLILPLPLSLCVCGSDAARHPIIQMTLCIYHVCYSYKASLFLSLFLALPFIFTWNHNQFLWFSFSEYNYYNQFLSFNSNDQWEFQTETETLFFTQFIQKKRIIQVTTWNIFEWKGRLTGNSQKRETKNYKFLSKNPK